jgi:hypothetical protein
MQAEDRRATPAGRLRAKAGFATSVKPPLRVVGKLPRLFEIVRYPTRHPLRWPGRSSGNLSKISLLTTSVSRAGADATRSWQILSRSRHGAKGGAIAVAMSRMVAATLSLRATTCQFYFAQARRWRELTSEQQQAELPLEHVGPEPKDVAQLCVAEASKSDKWTSRARVRTTINKVNRSWRRQDRAFQDRSMWLMAVRQIAVAG